MNAKYKKVRQSRAKKKLIQYALEKAHKKRENKSWLGQAECVEFPNYQNL